MVRVVLFGLCGFFLSLILTDVCKRAGRRYGVVAMPREDRWHRQPVPLLGGAAIALTLAAVIPFAVSITAGLAAFLCGAAALFALGLADDLRALAPHTKLIGQIVVAAVLAAVGLQLRLTTVPVVNVALTVFWIVWISNAFNLLDNMDGLAAGIAAITVAFRIGFFLIDGNLEGAVLAAVFLGAVLGFLVHNFSPASIFMGDAGSLLVGLFVSGLSLVGGYPYSRGIASVLLFPVLILLVPIFDTTFVTMNRVLARRPVSVGGRDHTSHRLVALGLTERRAVLWLYGIAGVSGSVAYLTYRFGLSYAVALVVFLVLGTIVLGLFLSRVRIYPDDGRPIVEAALLVRVLTRFSTRRQLMTVAVDVVLIVLAYYSAYLLRFEAGLRLYQDAIIASLPIVIACQIGAFAVFRVHYGIWRYTGLRDLIRIVKAVSAGTVAAVVALVYVYRFVGYSRAVIVLDWMLLIVFVSAVRLSFRVLAEYLRPDSAASKRVLLYGAGEGGMLVLRELHVNRALGRSLVGFIDDDPIKQQRWVQGVPVLGGSDQLAEILRKYRVDELVIASLKIPAERVRRVARICEEEGVRMMRAALHFG